MNYQAEIEAIAKSIKDHPCTAVQGLNEPEVKQMQLHYLKGNDEHPEFFALVMEKTGDKCKVVPGTIDAYSAGTNDVILPRSAMGGYVALSLDMEQEIPVEALGNGFARLDKPTFDRAQESLMRFRGGGMKLAEPLQSAFPYISDHDSRIVARHQLKKAVAEAVRSVGMLLLGKEMKARIAMFFQELKAKAAEVDEIFTLPVLEPLKAVAGEESRVRVMACRIKDMPGVEIEIETKIEEPYAVVTAYRNDELTTDLDGFALVEETGTPLGRLENGKCTIVDVKAFAGRPLALCDVQGNNDLHALVEVR